MQQNILKIGENTYNDYIPGDCTYEINGGANTGWFGDWNAVMSAGYPFFHHGGLYTNSPKAGVFFSSGAEGWGKSMFSFRVVLAGPKTSK